MSLILVLSGCADWFSGNELSQLKKRQETLNQSCEEILIEVQDNNGTDSKTGSYVCRAGSQSAPKNMIDGWDKLVIYNTEIGAKNTNFTGTKLNLNKLNIASLSPNFFYEKYRIEILNFNKEGRNHCVLYQDIGAEIRLGSMQCFDNPELAQQVFAQKDGMALETNQKYNLFNTNDPEYIDAKKQIDTAIKKKEVEIGSK